MVLVALLLTLRSTQALVETHRLVEHTQEVVEELEVTQAAVARAESSQRGFIITSDERLLRVYQEEVSGIPGHLARLRELTAENPDQQQRVADLGLSIRGKLQTMEELQQGATAGVAAAAAVLESGRGITAMERVNADIDALLNAARSSREQDLSRNSAAVFRVFVALAAVGGVGVLILGIGYAGVRGRIRAQRSAESASRSTEARSRQVVERMITGLITTDDAGRIESANPAATHMFGYLSAEIVGRDLMHVLAVPNVDQAGSLDALVGAGLGRVTEWEGRRKDSTTFPLDMALFEFRDDTGRHFAVNVRDISERREVDRLKGEFVSVVSHELRTPLTSIRGALQLVLGERPSFKDPDHGRLLDIALNNCERLIRIINDILDVSKIEAGQIELKLRACSVENLVRSSIQAVEEMARAASVPIVVEVDPELPAIRGDFDRLVQVLVNLLGNAVKFTPTGSIVTVRAGKVSNGIALSVRDQGPGIAKSDIDKLFRRFKQLDSSATRKAGGTGLGLAIVKALVEQHGGAVAATSQLGEGSTFTVTLPVDAASAPDRASRLSSAATGSPGPKVLVVDDDDDVRLVLRRHLERAGYQVREAADGEAAVLAALQEMPNLITMDLVMPGLDGVSAIRQLSAEARTASIPIIVVSAMADTMPIGHRFAVIGKPVSPDALLREIADLLRRHATVLLAEDDGDLRDVLSKALTLRGFKVLTATDGVRAQQLYDEAVCDLVVVDLCMPLLDGFDVIRHVRESPRGKAIPIVAISGSNSGHGEMFSLQLGANVYLAKPLNAEDLVGEIHRLLAPERSC
jgi:PAS domain S-box-containing protein